MSPINRVVLAGASGNLGPTILNELLAAGFQVTVLTRPESNHSFPEGVTVKKVDYDSVDSLADALRGHDGVVSNVGHIGLAKQASLIEAAVRAGIKRFLPSEFGSDLANPKNSTFPPFADKIAIIKLLEEKAKTTDLTYTFVRTGAFLDWGLSNGFILDLRGKNVTLFDGGIHRFSSTSLATVGKAVVGVFKHPEETKNRAVYVHDAVTTLKELQAMAKKAVGDDGWTENVVSVDELVTGAWAELKSKNPDQMKSVIPFIQASCWGGEAYGSPFRKVDNELFGIKQLNESELQAVVDSCAK